MSKKKITYEEFIERLSGRTGKSESELRDIVDNLNESISEGLTKDGEVRLSSFGKLELRRSSEREGIHPQTGETITIPAQTHARFNAGSKLEKAVNKEYAHLESEVIKEETTPSVPAIKRGFYKPMDVVIEYPVAAAMAITAGIIALLFFFLLRPDMPEVVQETAPIETETTEVAPPVVAEEEKVTEPEEFEHKVTFNEKLWTIADKYYESSYWWPVIYFRNEDVIPHPDFILEHMKIYVPNINNQDNRNKIIATAYLDLYHFYRNDFNDAARDFLYAARVYDRDVVESSETDIPSEDLTYALYR